MIRFGPAAAPRWFNQDLARLEQYLDLIKEEGGSAIEFVVLPGPGSGELGRVHLLEPIAPQAIALAQSRGLRVSLHAPLTPEFRITTWVADRAAYRQGFNSVIDLLRTTEGGQSEPPRLVIHAAVGGPDTTAEYLEWLTDELRARRSSALISVELRGPTADGQSDFDRSMPGLVNFISSLELDKVGICWDVAHDWEHCGGISTLTPDLLCRINHVHIHGSRPSGEVHAPLDSGSVPWRSALEQLRDARWDGSVTLEIRYRYAAEQGEPWDVLRASLRAARAVLAGE